MNDYCKYLSIASSIKEEKKIPNIKSIISQSQNDTKQAILTLMNKYEDENYLYPLQTEPNTQMEKSTRSQLKSLNISSINLKQKRTIRLKANDHEKLHTELGSIKATPRKKPTLLKQLDSLPLISAPSIRTNDTSGKQSHYTEYSAKNSRVITDQCDDIMTNCSLFKDTIIRCPIEKPLSTYYYPQNQIKQILHKKDVESLGVSNETSDVLLNLKKKQILENSAIIKNISNNFAHGAQKLLKKMFLVDEKIERKKAWNEMIMSKRLKRKKNILKQMVENNLSANERCIKYLDKCIKLN